MNKDIALIREAAVQLSSLGGFVNAELSIKLRALADRMEAAKPINPDCYWEPDCCEVSYSNVLDYVNDCGACWAVGDTFNMSEAHYLDAEFRITKVRNDETDDEYEVERISGKNIYTNPFHAATSEPTPAIGADIQADGASQEAMAFVAEDNEGSIQVHLTDDGYLRLMGGDKLYTAKPISAAIPDGWKLLKDSTHNERTWHEDLAQENGYYSCTCTTCGRAFAGHKRRNACRVCAAPVQGE